ncbi:MAG: hypothetical protein AAF383_07775 [Cyanobacteria bacterium P01_A01_bin.83]
MLTICLIASEFSPDIGGGGLSAKRIAFSLKELGEQVRLTEQDGITVHLMYAVVVRESSTLLRRARLF